MAAIPGRDAAGTHRETGPGTEGCAVGHVTEADRARSVLSALMVLTGLTADWALAGATNPRAVPRAGSAIAMFLGAGVGVALFLHHGPGLPLVISATAAALASVPVEASSSIRGYLDEK